jgi:NAD(P)-dependent dehydrogenase (short-subunit alcohol dehydrogenase family)
MRFPASLFRRTALDVTGRSVLITGAGKGIGRALVEELLRRGARVALVDSDSQALASAASGPRDVLTHVVDVRDRDAMSQAVAGTVEHFGSLDLVVANAGVAPTPATLRTIEPDEYDRVVAVNQTGVFNTVHPAIEPIIASRGHIVVVASVAAIVPGPGGAPYMISKAGVEQLGRTLRIELAPHGATAGVAYFGIVETEMTRATLDDHPLGRNAARLLPHPLRQRISTARAAEVMADGIARRARRTIAPRAWILVAALRGMTGATDWAMAVDPRTRRLLGELERSSQPGGRAKPS